MVAERSRSLRCTTALVLLLTSANVARAQPRRDAEPPPSEPPAAVLEPAAPLGEVKVSERGNVEMHVAEQPLSTVLQMLSLQGRRNIIATPSVVGTVTADLYDVSFDEALEAILVANQCGYRQQGNFIYIYTNEELAQLIAAENPPQTRVFRLYYTTAADAALALTPLLSDIGTVTASTAADAGIEPDAASAGGDAYAAHDYLVVYDYPDRLREVEQILSQLDVQPQQVLIEATILRATLDDENALGVDFTMVGGVDLEVLGSTSSGITDLQTGSLPTDRLEKFNAAVETDMNQLVPKGGVTVGIIKDHVGMFIRALEQVTDTVLLANPKILALNKQKGQVMVGRRDGYITTTVTETQAIQTVEFLETGTQLIFRPFIGRDGDVRMELHPEDSVGGLSAANLPFETTTELTTNVSCKDGQTILIGGLFREVSSASRSQIPLLGDIPGLGTAFRSRADNSSWEEVIILLTVHIVKNADEYAEATRKEAEDIERIRVGLRKGLMWHGRERLAQAHYREALARYADGDVSRALWNVRLALHNQPRLLSAIKLKEEMLGRRAWDDEGDVARSFISRLIREESFPGSWEAPFFDRPNPIPAKPEGLRGPSGFEHDQILTTLEG